MNNQKMRTPLVGGSSLLVVFAVLCLTVFALLGLSTVQANKRLSDASIDAVKHYYEADLQAEMILSRLRNGDISEEVKVDNGVYSYSCPMSETQQLLVEVRIDGTTWEILRWQTVSIAQWNEEESVSVWDGKN